MPPQRRQKGIINVNEDSCGAERGDGRVEHETGRVEDVCSNSVLLVCGPRFNNTRQFASATQPQTMATESKPQLTGGCFCGRLRYAVDIQ